MRRCERGLRYFRALFLVFWWMRNVTWSPMTRSNLSEGGLNRLMQWLSASMFFTVVRSEWHGFGHGFSWVRVQVRVPGPVTNPYPPYGLPGYLDVTSHQWCYGCYHLIHLHRRDMSSNPRFCWLPPPPQHQPHHTTSGQWRQDTSTTSPHLDNKDKTTGRQASIRTPIKVETMRAYKVCLQVFDLVLILTMLLNPQNHDMRWGGLPLTVSLFHLRHVKEG
jgi:hypothetical protein